MDAERALCWLRGWVEPRAIRQELLEMIRYSESSKLRKPSPSQMENAAYSNHVSIEDEKSAANIRVKSEENSEDPKRKSEFVNIDLVDRSNSGAVQVNSRCEENEKRETNIGGDHETDWRVRVKDFLRPEMLRPLGLVVAFFFFLNTSGISAMRPYFIKVFEKLNFPISPLRSTVSTIYDLMYSFYTVSSITMYSSHVSG